MDIKLLTIRKSDFNYSKLDEREIHEVVMAYAEFGFDDNVYVDTKNAHGEYIKSGLIKDLIEWTLEDRYYQKEIDPKYCLCSEHSQEMLFDLILSKLKRNYTWLKVSHSNDEVSCD